MRAGLLLLALVFAATARAGEIAPAERRPGSDFMSAETRAMQAEDSANPATLWVEEGAALWNRPEGAAALACASCHGDAGVSMAGVAARYPALDAVAGRPLDLTGRVNRCRTERQKAPALAHESDAMLALTAFIARQSRGLPIAPPEDPRLAPFRASGHSLFDLRMGQLDLSCAQCHDANWGRSLGGAPIPQAHPTGYPLYRLEWQALGSLQRRLRNCLAGVRAEPWAFDAPELVEIELYLMSRAAGMAMDAPAVRP